MNTILTYIKKCIPRQLFQFLQPPYHFALGFCAALFYGFPSNKMIVVGITGTTGKTTVTYLTAQVLRAAGFRVGYTSTALFSDGVTDRLNDKKMTMLGRFFTQRMLAQMAKNKCDIAIVETTSEGIAQFRHRFINYDIALFTGLYPEHIDAHGSFENYKKAKLKLFAHLARCAQKTQLTAKLRDVQKTIIANGDDPHTKDVLRYAVARKVVFTKNVNDVAEYGQGIAPDVVHYLYYETNAHGVRFAFDGKGVQLGLLGAFTATNAAAAATVAQVLGVDLSTIRHGLEGITSVPGRIETVDEGQDFTVIVDYAFEPVALAKLYETTAVLKPKRMIHVLGTTGGGRDASRRTEVGKIAGTHADVVIATNEDPYDYDPVDLIEAVARGAYGAGKRRDQNLFCIDDRGEAIAKAITLARTGDLVLITGKGSEQAIAGKNGTLTPWDDREAARASLQTRMQQSS